MGEHRGKEVSLSLESYGDTGEEMSSYSQIIGL